MSINRYLLIQLHFVLNIANNVENFTDIISGFKSQ